MQEQYQLSKSLFNTQKKDTLAKIDKSKKGSIDPMIAPLLDTINSFSSYFTTSSCSGRIMLFAAQDKKKDAIWHFVSHNKITVQELQEALDTRPKNTAMSLLMLGAIIHVACDSIESAQEFLTIARSVGFKKAGIYTISKKKILVEAVAPEHLEVPLGTNNNSNKASTIPFDETYLTLLTAEANKKIDATHGRIEALKQKLIELQHKNKSQ